MKITELRAYKIWMKFAKKLGVVQGCIMFSIIYFFIIGAYALIFFVFVALKKLLKRNKSAVNTYWIPEEKNQQFSLEQLQQQF